MKRWTAVILAVLIVGFFAGCGETVSREEIRQMVKSSTLSGNFERIKVFNPDGKPQLILIAVDEFRKLHPELTVVAWAPDFNNYLDSPGYSHVWIMHQPSQAAETSKAVKLSDIHLMATGPGPNPPGDPTIVPKPKKLKAEIVGFNPNGIPRVMPKWVQKEQPAELQGPGPDPPADPGYKKKWIFGRIWDAIWE